VIRILAHGATIPGKENGFDIEGLAVYRNRIFLGCVVLYYAAGPDAGNRARDDQPAIVAKANWRGSQKSILFI